MVGKNLFHIWLNLVQFWCNLYTNTCIQVSKGKNAKKAQANYFRVIIFQSLTEMLPFIAKSYGKSGNFCVTLNDINVRYIYVLYSS